MITSDQPIVRRTASIVSSVRMIDSDSVSKLTIPDIAVRVGPAPVLRRHSGPPSTGAGPMSNE